MQMEWKCFKLVDSLPFKCKYMFKIKHIAGLNANVSMLFWQ